MSVITRPEMQVEMRSRVSIDAKGCWVWRGNTNPAGYGKASIFGHRGALAHRLSWLAFRGQIPEGLTIDHLCFNPPCVNPDHLRLLTVEENHRNKKSATKTHCKHGHPLSGDNLHIRRNGSRKCRACDRDRHNSAYKAKKENVN